MNLTPERAWEIWEAECIPERPTRDLITAYARAIEAEVLRLSGWQPIETAPKDGTPVDIWCAEWKERAINMRRVQLAPDNIFYEPVESGPSCVRDATHWMPLAAAPRATGCPDTMDDTARFAADELPAILRKQAG